MIEIRTSYFNGASRWLQGYTIQCQCGNEAFLKVRINDRNNVVITALCYDKNCLIDHQETVRLEG